MATRQKKVVIDDHGRAQAVIMSWRPYQRTSEMFGLDLDAEAMADLRQAQWHRAARTLDACVKLDALGG